MDCDWLFPDCMQDDKRQVKSDTLNLQGGVGKLAQLGTWGRVGDKFRNYVYYGFKLKLICHQNKISNMAHMMFKEEAVAELPVHTGET